MSSAVTDYSEDGMTETTDDEVFEAKEAVAAISKILAPLGLPHRMSVLHIVLGTSICVSQEERDDAMILTHTMTMMLKSWVDEHHSRIRRELKEQADGL